VGKVARWRRSALREDWNWKWGPSWRWISSAEAEIGVRVWWDENEALCAQHRTIALLSDTNVSPSF
jgi:hypothetical protein